MINKINPILHNSVPITKCTQNHFAHYLILTALLSSPMIFYRFSIFNNSINIENLEYGSYIDKPVSSVSFHDLLEQLFKPLDCLLSQDATNQKIGIQFIDTLKNTGNRNNFFVSCAVLAHYFLLYPVTRLYY